ncbi:putative SP-containing protein [Vairimorpha necatrix]|uniref:SP-containing protein n=1 Tax=Vairimorpha necatrix TaxID=6039 RepID=A0AAX4J958_9MICR
MLQYMLFIISSAIETNEYKLLRESENYSRHEIDGINYKNYDNRELNSNTSNERYITSKKLKATSSNKTTKKTRKKQSSELLNVKNKFKRYNNYYNDISENTLYYTRRKICFNNFLNKWEDEKLKIEKISHYRRFNKDESDQYAKNYCPCNRWLRKYNEILNKFLPRILKEIEKSKMEETFKKQIMDHIKIISRAMRYFAKIYPQNANYLKYYDYNILYYRLMVYRLPYLFNYFDLGGRFVKLYEMLIDQYVNKLDITNIMTTTLFEMSEKFIYVIKLRKNFLEKIKSKLNLLEKLK